MEINGRGNKLYYSELGHLLNLILRPHERNTTYKFSLIESRTYYAYIYST